MRKLAVICVLIGLSVVASAQCSVPKFYTARDFSNETEGSLRLSIERRDFTVQKLICLVQYLKKRHPGWKGAWVAIYDSREAAENHMLGDTEISVSPALWREWGSHYHAGYSLGTDGKQLFYISPFGDGIVDYSFRWNLDLPLSGPPRCGIRMLPDRCLMAVTEQITYPESALKEGAFGRVTLTGVIKQDGSVDRLVVKEADVRPAQSKELLTGAAMKNLKTWQFDAADHETPFEIDFSYVMDTGPLARGQYDGQLTVVPNVPWNVEIRVKAPK